MTNAVAAFRSLVVWALILPLALLMGYMLATPMDPSTLVVLSLVLLVLTAPLILHWHHPLLFLTWNMTAVMFMLPGRPQLWLLASFMSLGISIFQRALNPEMRFIRAGSVVAPVLFLTLVVVVTGKVTGGFGLRIFGGDVYGGRRYLMVLAGAVGFLAMLARPVPLDKARLYVGLFFLGMITDAIGSSLPFLSPAFYFIFYMFPVELTGVDPGPSSLLGTSITRFWGSSLACQGVFYYLLARYGIAQMLRWRTVWRLILLVASVAMCAYGGFRSFLALMCLTFVVMFCFEGLLRSKHAITFGLIAICGSAALFPLVAKLPLSIQRSLSVVPFLEINPIARYDAQASTEWRLQMWRILWPQIPGYLWMGKGLGISGQDLELTTALAERNLVSSQEVAMLAGDYHSGPLSVIIPFGIWGAIGWLWFLAASIRALYYNRMYGDESLKTINTFLLAYFVARTIHFFAIFGGFYADFALFSGIVGLGLCLNGGIRKPAVVPVPVLQPPEPSFPPRLKPSAGLSA